MADSVWSGTESPYGPTFLSADGVLDQASGHQILADLVLLRLLEVAGIALMVAATPTLARSLKRDPAHAVLLGAGSPLVLLSLVAGSHNDALMVGLLMAGLAVAKRFGTVPGVILCALAAGVKSPAALGVLFLGWVWAGPGASTRRRIGHTVGAGLIALATMEVVSLVSGTGWGWVRTTTTADASFTGVTPVNVVARAVSIVSHVLQVPISTMDARPVFSVLGLLIAVYVGYRLLLRSPQDGVVRCLGLTLLVLALLGPIVWAWYVTWGVVVLAPAAVGRLRTALIVISTFWAFAGMTAVHGIYMRLIHTFVLTDLLLVAMLLAVAITPLGLLTDGRSRTRLPRLVTGVLAGAGRAPGAGPGAGTGAGRRGNLRPASTPAQSAAGVPACAGGSPRRAAVGRIGLGPGLDHRPEGGRVVRVLLVGELHVACVVQHGDVVRLVDRAVAGVLHPVLDAADPPAALLVAHAPRVGERVHGPVGPLRHERGDPGVDLLTAVEGAERVLEVHGVVGEQVGPVAATRRWPRTGWPSPCSAGAPAPARPGSTVSVMTSVSIHSW